MIGLNHFVKHFQTHIMEYTNYVPQLAAFCLEPDNNSMSSNSSYYNSLYSIPNSYDSNTYVNQPDTIPRKSGRRPNETNDLSYEEQGKVKERRERNKLAAARCRKRRYDHTMELNDEVDDLEMKKTDLQHEIEDLEAEKNELLLLFNAHQSQCKMQPEMSLKVEADNFEGSETEIEPDLRYFEVPVLRKLSSFSSFALPTVTQSQSGFQGLLSNTRSVTSFNFESLMQGGTGLTPQNSFIEIGKKN